MKHYVRALLCALLITVLLATMFGVAYAALKLPQPEGHVNDFAGMLSQQTNDTLEKNLRDYTQKSGNEIAVVTVRDLQGTTVEDFAVRLFEKWQIGKKDKDNGVLLLIAEKEHKVRIEVGYGLEPNLTDGRSFAIIRNTITPAFKAGDYDGGVTASVDAIIKTISGDYTPATSPISGINPGHNFSVRDLTWLIYPALFLGLGLFQWLVSVLGRTKSWWLGGALGAIVGLIVMLFSVIVGVILLSMLVPLGLLLDYVVSRAYNDHDKKKHNEHKDASMIPWWAGGGWGPGGFGGGGDSGGFGGFGGGGSGGGGASGDW
ncbi:MAG TPA: TPM domain-containing protein [Candidatus Aquicultor sp.]|jgi:uncharacterized protein